MIRRWGLSLLAMVLSVVMGILIASSDQQQLFESPLSPRVYLPIIMSYKEIAQGAGATYANCDRIQEAGLSWFYNWGPYPPPCSSAERVAMIWGRSSVGAVLDQDIEWVLGFNEPENSGQANIIPTLAAELWFEIEQDYPDKKLVSPAASPTWLNQWYWAYQSRYGHAPRLDAVAHHCYGPWNVATAVSQCKNAVDQSIAFVVAHGISEVWVTEFAMLPCWPEGESGSVEFMQQMVNYYRSVPEVTRWAWFQNSYYGTEPWSFGPACNTSLVNIDTGELTLSGDAYKELLGGW